MNCSAVSGDEFVSINLKSMLKSQNHLFELLYL